MQTEFRFYNPSHSRLRFQEPRPHPRQAGFTRHAMGTVALVLMLAGCTESDFAGMDWDMRSTTALNTSEAARQATVPRPRPDDRGVISYPGYQVAVARRGETVTSIAGRLGLSADALARRNAIAPDVPLRMGEVLVLPQRVDDATAMAGSFNEGPIGAPGSVDVSTIASGAITRAEQSGSSAQASSTTPRQPGAEPMRHRVQRGETVYSISRLYNVTTRALADWNGLGADLALREGQTLLIPPVVTDARTAAVAPTATAPGRGSPTPEPPSAARPLPAVNPPPASATTAAPASPDLGSQRTAVTAARFAMPADGAITRAYQKGRNEGIGIGAAAGSPVRAAADGTVAAITRDTDQVPIVVVRHPDNLLTVYANVDNISVSKDMAVKRGQQIGRVLAGNPAFLHFEVRRGFESVDPMPYLQ